MNKINETIKHAFDNRYVSGVVIVVGIIYAILFAPSLPPKVAQLFGQRLFNLIVLFLIAYVSVYDITVGLVLAIGFVISIMTYNRLLVENKMLMENEPSASYVNSMHHSFGEPANFVGQADTEQGLKQVIKNKQAQMVLPPDIGFETGTVASGCYGSTTGLQGYDNDDTYYYY